MKRAVTVAVTGLNATDNPAPGVGVIRAIRAHPEFCGRIVGLGYDGLEPGIYCAEVDSAFLLPAPSQGLAAFEERLRQVHERTRFDVIIPNLDAELPSFIALEPKLQAMGVGCYLPSAELLDRRSKVHLQKLCAVASIATPKTKVITPAEDLDSLDRELRFPCWIKGAYYGAALARDLREANLHYHHMLDGWGPPVIAQAHVEGPEIDVIAVGDGQGGMIGALPMRKRVLSDKGKAWAGTVIRDPAILELARRYFSTTCWRGPCELELVRAADGALHLIEVNPRFPAWCYLAAGAGMNLPYAVTELALGRSVRPMTEYEAGMMFVRIAVDQLVPLARFESISTRGELGVGFEASR